MPFFLSINWWGEMLTWENFLVEFLLVSASPTIVVFSPHLSLLFLHLFPLSHAPLQDSLLTFSRFSFIMAIEDISATSFVRLPT